jgi:hypothetical protein
MQVFVFRIKLHMVLAMRYRIFRMPELDNKFLSRLQRYASIFAVLNHEFH